MGASLSVTEIKTLEAQLFKIRKAVLLTFGQMKFREVVGTELKVEIALSCYQGGIVRGSLNLFRVFGEKRAHFLLGLEIKLAALKAHAVGVVYGLTGLYAKEHVLIVRIFPFYVVGVVGQHKRYSRFAVELDKTGGNNAIFAYAVRLHFEIKIVPAEELAELQGPVFCCRIIPVDYLLLYLSCKTARKANKPLGVLLEELPVYTGLYVEALNKPRAD